MIAFKNIHILITKSNPTLGGLRLRIKTVY